VEGTTDFHHDIADALLPQAEPVFDNATTLHAAVDMLDPEPTLVQRLVRPLLLQRKLVTAGFLRGHEDIHVGQRKGQEAQILQQSAPRGQGIGRRVGNGLIMDTAAVGVTEEEDQQQSIDQQDIFDRVVLFLATITIRLGSRALGADDTSFGPVMGKRGESGTTAGTAPRGTRSSSSGVTTVAASASETPSRCARAVRERVGASPRARSAAK
jgi:hypothetical protein